MQETSDGREQRRETAQRLISLGETNDLLPGNRVGLEQDELESARLCLKLLVPCLMHVLHRQSGLISLPATVIS